MRILCRYASCGPSYVMTGWANVFRACGHTFLFYDDSRPIHDLFHEFQPDLLLSNTYSLDRATINCLTRRPECLVVLYASAWGELVKDVNPQEYPITLAADKEKATVEFLKERTGKPDLVWLHLTDEFVEPVLGGWKEIGCQPIGLLNAADTFTYYGGKFDPELACDVGFVGGYWPYKARTIDQYFLPLCHPDWSLKPNTPPARLKIKIWGNQTWPVAQYLGLLAEERTKDVFASATVCPNVHEPHSHLLNYDVVERPFKILCAGGFCVSDHVWSLTRSIYKDNEIPAFHTPWDYQEAILHFVHHPQDRLPHMRKGHITTLTKHTYWHRVGELMRVLGCDKELATLQARYHQWLEEVVHDEEITAAALTPGVA